jgi:hypothetical protein
MLNVEPAVLHKVMLLSAPEFGGGITVTQSTVEYITGGHGVETAALKQVVVIRPTTMYGVVVAPAIGVHGPPAPGADSH